MKGEFQEHRVMICLDTDLYLAFMKLSGDKGLGRAFAGLLPWVEGMYQMGYINKEVYEFHVKRYSEPLSTKKPWTSPEDTKKQVLNDKAKKTIEDMIEQFAHFKEKDNQAWMASARSYAERFGDLQCSKTLLGMIKTLPDPPAKEPEKKEGE